MRLTLWGSVLAGVVEAIVFRFRADALEVSDILVVAEVVL